MIGYTYTIEQDAINARTLCAVYAGLPNPSGDTLYWVNYRYSNIENIYYIEYVEGLENVLNSPSEFTVTIPILQ